MLIIGDVLTAEDVETVRAGVMAAPLLDGRKTAGGQARKVKANHQADGADVKVKALAKFVRQALDRNAVFQLYARPARLSGVMFNRYGPGETYGLHVDEAMMQTSEGRLRTDFSFTLFLSDPDSYEGGELAQAGTMVVYSTGALHRVNPVTRGERLAAIGWVQSLVRRPDEREVLFDLGRARAALPEGEARLLVDKAMGNLLRIWGEP
jgi:PKHD-type hydroxylase